MYHLFLWWFKLVFILIITPVYLWCKALVMLFNYFKIHNIGNKAYNKFGNQAIGIISLGIIFYLITILLFLNSKPEDFLRYMTGFSIVGAIVCLVIMPLIIILCISVKNNDYKNVNI